MNAINHKILKINYLTNLKTYRNSWELRIVYAVCNNWHVATQNHALVSHVSLEYFFVQAIERGSGQGIACFPAFPWKHSFLHCIKSTPLMTIDLFTSTDINNVKQRTSFQSWVHVRPVISSLDMSISSSVSVSLPSLPPCVCLSMLQLFSGWYCLRGESTLLKKTPMHYCCILTYLINV